MKDPQGRYTCKECLTKARGTATRAASAQIPAAAPTPLGRAGPTLPDEAGVLSGLIDASLKEQGPPCPTCGSPMKAEQVLCVRCGFNKVLGKAAKTQVVAAPRDKLDTGVTASKAVGAAASILILSNPIAWAAGGMIGGAIGAVIWAAVAYHFHYEISWIAIGVGALSGVGVAAVAQGNTGPFSGGLAAVIAVVAVFAGKYAAVSMVVDDVFKNRPRQITLSADRALVFYARDFAMEREAAGQQLNWPDGMSAEDTGDKEDFPRDVWAAAEQRWNSGTPEFRESYRKEKEAEINGELAAITQTGFMASFSPFDVLWILLAIAAAYGAGSGGGRT